MIERLQDLCGLFSADRPSQLNRRLYKATDCGAWISVTIAGWKSFYNGDDWAPLDEMFLTEPGVIGLESFTIGSIVEGPEAEFEETFTTPCAPDTVDAWVEELERLTDAVFPQESCDDEQEE